MGHIRGLLRTRRDVAAVAAGRLEEAHVLVGPTPSIPLGMCDFY